MAVTSDVSLSAACVLRLCCSLHTRVGRLCLMGRLPPQAASLASPWSVTTHAWRTRERVSRCCRCCLLLTSCPVGRAPPPGPTERGLPTADRVPGCPPFLSTRKIGCFWASLSGQRLGLRACTATARVQSPVGSGGPASQGVPTQSAASCSPGSLGGPHGPMRRPLGKLRLHSCVSILSSLSPLTTCVRVCVLSPSPAQLLQPVGLYLPPNLRTLSAAASLNHFLLPAALRPALALTCSPLRPLSSVTFAGSLTSSCC